MDKISIILPIYNGEKYLERCIDSILNQTYKNIELICVNDGSVDNSLNILKQYQTKDSRIVIIDKKNTGVSDTRNHAIKKSTGKYIAFCDADDMYEKNYIELIYKILIEKNVDAVRCNFRVIDTNYKQIDEGDLSELDNKLFDSTQIKNKIIPMALNGRFPCFSYLIVVKRDKVKNIKFPTDIHMMEDVVFYLNLLLNLDNIYIINKCLYTIMFNNEGATNSVKNYERNIFNIIEVNKYIMEILKKHKIYNNSNIENLNLNHLNAISDFIFKYYIHNGKDAIRLCKKLSSNKGFIEMIDKANLSDINVQRKIIIQNLKPKRYKTLSVCLKLRKIIYKLKRM